MKDEENLFLAGHPSAFILDSSVTRISSLSKVITTEKTYQGSCHCGAVRFETDIDLAAGTCKCNCSICFKTRAWMAFIPADAFRLLSGEQDLREYQFAKKSIHHMFCARCGVRPFAHGSDGKGNRFYAVRVNCLDGVDPQELIDAPVNYFDMLHDDFTSPPAETRHL